MQALRNVPPHAAGPEALRDPDEAKAARNVANTVMKVLTSHLSSVTGQARDTGADQGQRRDDDRRVERSSKGGFSDEADQRVRDAVKVAVYKTIVDMISGLQNTMHLKQSIGEAISTYDHQLAGEWVGTKDMPVYAMDWATGTMKAVGTKALTYEEALAERNKLKDQKDSISELNQQDMLWLQLLMANKNQLEQMISNVMKDGYAGGQAAISALKAS